MIIRLGKKVSVVFPGLEEEIALYAAEQKNAVEEGVRFESLVHPLEILSTGDHMVKGVQCERLDFIENAGGHWDVKAVPGSEFVLEADTVIIAEDPAPSEVIKRFLPGLKWTDEGTLWVDPETGKTSIDRLFAAGDVVTGAGRLVDAMASGKRVASAIDQYLSADRIDQDSKG